MEPLSHAILEQIVAASREGILLAEATPPGFSIVYVNTAFEEQSGYAASELIGSAWGSHFADRDDSPDLIELKRAVACREPCRSIVPFIRKDGEIWRADTEISPISGPGGRPLVLVQHQPVEGMQRDRAGQQTRPRRSPRLRPKIVALECSDLVTGLSSLEHFMNLLRRDLLVARRDQRPITLLLFEVVELDVYRKTFGANAADSCMRMIGAQLAGTFGRASDLCARCDEARFVAAIQGQGLGSATLLAERVAQKARSLGLHNPRAKSERHITLRSVAIEADVGRDDAEGLLERAKAELCRDIDAVRCTA